MSFPIIKLFTIGIDPEVSLIKGPPFALKPKSLSAKVNAQELTVVGIFALAGPNTLTPSVLTLYLY